MEPEVRKAIAELQKELGHIFRCDNALKSVKRALGDKAQEMTFSMSTSMYGASISVTMEAPYERLHYIDDQLSDENRQECIKDNEMRATENIEAVMEVCGRLHRTLCIDWMLTGNYSWRSTFSGKMFDGLSINVSIDGPLSPEYRDVEKKQRVSETYHETVAICEVGWTPPQGYED